jgi:carbon monoxide dehydrogenase subunit G
MDLKGTYTFNAPRDIVWQALLDPEVLARVMPGCEKLEQIGGNQYEGAIKIKVGPVQGKFQGKVTLENINEPDSYSMIIDGKGASGFMKGEGQVKLEPQDDSTLMHYEGKAQVGGRIASVGQRLLDSSAKALTRQSLDNLAKQIEARAQTAASGNGGSDEGGASEKAAEPPSAAAAPSEMEFAAGVAKNMLDDILPPEYRWIVIVGVIVVLAIIAYFIWGG